MDAPAPPAPSNDGEHKLVFLNELHETLKRLDPRRVQNAGLFRILGRLVEYDMDNQIIKVESVFHHEYTAQPIVHPTTATAAAAATRSRSRSRSRTRPTKHKSQDGSTLKQLGRQGHPSSTPRPGPRAGPDGQELYRGPNNSNNRMTIDLTLDDGDEDEVMGEVDHYDSQGEEEDASLSNNSNTYHHDTAVSKNPCVDLTSTDDEQEEEHISTIAPSSSNNPQESTTALTTSRKPRRAPKVVLWVDTQLLDAGVFEANALFQFMGEVVYCHPVVAATTPTITTTAAAATTTKSIDSGSGIKANGASVRGRGGGGHWVLQARTARLMDGLDLYSYRQAILLTRQLVQQYEQRDKERELEKAKAKEKEKEQKAQKDCAMVVELE